MIVSMFSLTRQEKLLLISFATVILLGVGINYFLKKRAGFVSFYNSSDIRLGKAKLNININKAGRDELMRLPGVGQEIATRIIEQRNRQGGFKDKEELKNIKGIGEKKFEKIKEYIRLSDNP